MTKEIFAKIVAEKLPDLLPEAYKNVKIGLSERSGINVKDETLYFKMEGTVVTPSISVDSLFDIYSASDDINQALSEIAGIVTKGLEEDRLFSDIDQARELIDNNVVLRLVNTDSNKAMLENVPHRETNDCSAYYKIIYSSNKGELMSTDVSNAMAEELGYTEQELFDRAVVNTKRIQPPAIRTMTEIMGEMCGLSREEMEMFTDVENTDKMIIISNDSSCYGAVYMLYDECLQEAAKRLGGDIYVLPSSLHEVITVPADMGMDVKELSEMVTTINSAVVDAKDRLSNQVYHYSRDERKLTMVSDGINRSVTDLVADKAFKYEDKKPVR